LRFNLLSHSGRSRKHLPQQGHLFATDEQASIINPLPRGRCFLSSNVWASVSEVTYCDVQGIRQHLWIQRFLDYPYLV